MLPAPPPPPLMINNLFSNGTPDNINVNVRTLLARDYPAPPVYPYRVFRGTATVGGGGLLEDAIAGTGQRALGARLRIAAEIARRGIPNVVAGIPSALDNAAARAISAVDVIAASRAARVAGNVIRVAGTVADIAVIAQASIAVQEYRRAHGEDDQFRGVFGMPLGYTPLSSGAYTAGAVNIVEGFSSGINFLYGRTMIPTTATIAAEAARRDAEFVRIARSRQNAFEIEQARRSQFDSDIASGIANARYNRLLTQFQFDNPADAFASAMLRREVYGYATPLPKVLQLPELQIAEPNPLVSQVVSELFPFEPFEGPLPTSRQLAAGLHMLSRLR